ncbi:MAG: DUF2971 domain-containing protein [Clostridia bacterium]|nr:DUF2971 domain-containing protein [Clostridia bacterium]
MIVIKQQKIEKLQEYKKSLIYEYVTGKKEVVQMANNAYKEYEKMLYSYANESILSEDVVNELFSELLKVLPNNGKLYKYKALSTFHLDELEDKYVWFSSAKNLNDKKDCTFNVLFPKEMEALVKFFLKDDNYRKFLATSLHSGLAKFCRDLTLTMVEDALKCFSGNGPKLANLQFDAFCKKYRLNKSQKQLLLQTSQLYRIVEPSDQLIRNIVGRMFNQMQEVRNSMHILSLTTSYDKDSMWAYYCNNEGICIEYDFARINTAALKRVFINTQKVRYGKKKKFSIVELFKSKIYNDHLVESEKMIFEQLLTKEKSWRAEEEWRTIINDRGNTTGSKIPADIVSAVYLDYSILQKDKAQQIISLAQTNKWAIYIRYFSELEGQYRYVELEDLPKLSKIENWTRFSS